MPSMAYDEQVDRMSVCRLLKKINRKPKMSLAPFALDHPVDKNNWPRSRAVLTALGITNGPCDGHEHHYHVDFKTPTRVAIDTTARLLIAATTTDVNTVSVLPAALQDLALDAAQEFGLSEDVMDVNVIEIPDAGAPSVLVAAAPTAGKEKVMGVCLPTEQMRDDVQQSLGVDPSSAANRYFLRYLKQTMPEVSFDNIRIVKQPQHGQLTREKDGGGIDFYSYKPDFGYLGKDRFEAVVPVGNDTVRVIYYIVVQPNLTDQESFDSKKYCPKLDWKISLPTDAGPALQKIVSQAQRASGLTTAVIFADLPGSSVGQTLSTGLDAQITLDTNAAGYGWYIDATPSDKSEYLPTSTPNEWIAKPGSEAEGKMDLLTVLLHEYGHALGLDHSADAHDFMASSLQPGMRRTLSVDEQLQLMHLAGIFVTPTSPSEPYAPTDPGVPLPFTRVSNTTRSARQRRDDGGLKTLGLTQFETAANPTLTNPALADTTGWSTTGDVRIANGMATLSETASNQTRLNQAFVLGANDRFLTFTVANEAFIAKRGQARMALT